MDIWLFGGLVFWTYGQYQIPNTQYQTTPIPALRFEPH
jgi:hypothetical protein